MIQPYALVSPAELKATITAAGSAKDDVIERAINTASRLIEADHGRRLRHRAPEEEEGAANIVAGVAIGAQPQTLTIAEQPDSGGRCLIVTLTDADRSVKAGILTATGTVGGVAGQTEVFTLADGPRQHGRKFFTALTSLVVSGVTQPSTAGDLIKVGTSLGMVEYHTPRDAYRIRLMERPYAIAEVNEDSDRDYLTATALVANTDYELAAEGVITRVEDKTPYAWDGGYRSIKVRYSGWLGGLSTVPDDLRQLCIDVAGAIYQQYTRAEIGIQSQSDSMGNFTRFAPAGRLSDDHKDALANYRKPDIFTTTGERDFDLEAS